MRPQPQIPSAQDALHYFQAMAAGGRFPKTETRTRALYGSWGGGGGPSVLKISPTMKQPIVETILVTPTAMALEQAKSQLRETGEEIPGEEIPATQRGKTGH